MRYYVVVDTNIIVSALLSKHQDAATAKVLNALYDGKFTPLYNDEILAEYNDVLCRSKFNFTKEQIEATLDYFRKFGIAVERIASDEIFIDPKDIVFYEVCLAKRDENSMLVTGNMKHFPKKMFIVTPNELLDIIENTT